MAQCISSTDMLLFTKYFNFIETVWLQRSVSCLSKHRSHYAEVYGTEFQQRESLAHAILKVNMNFWLQFSKHQSYVEVIRYWFIALTQD